MQNALPLGAVADEPLPRPHEEPKYEDSIQNQQRDGQRRMATVAVPRSLMKWYELDSCCYLCTDVRVGIVVRLECARRQHDLVPAALGDTCKLNSSLCCILCSD